MHVQKVIVGIFRPKFFGEFSCGPIIGEVETFRPGAHVALLHSCMPIPRVLPLLPGHFHLLRKWEGEELLPLAMKPLEKLLGDAVVHNLEEPPMQTGISHLCYEALHDFLVMLRRIKQRRHVDHRNFQVGIVVVSHCWAHVLWQYKHFRHRFAFGVALIHHGPGSRKIWLGANFRHRPLKPLSSNIITGGCRSLRHLARLAELSISGTENCNEHSNFGCSTDGTHLQHDLETQARNCLSSALVQFKAHPRFTRDSWDAQFAVFASAFELHLYLISTRGNGSEWIHEAVSIPRSRPQSCSWVSSLTDTCFSNCCSTIWQKFSWWASQNHPWHPMSSPPPQVKRKRKGNSPPSPKQYCSTTPRKALNTLSVTVPSNQ